MSSVAVMYRSLYDTRPVQEVTSWGSLVQELQEHSEAKRDKEAGPLWSPVSLIPGGKRRNADVLAVNALVVDYDGGTALPEIEGRLQGREWIAYSTYSHSLGDPRFHLVVRLPEPISPEKWGEAYRSLRRALGLEQGDHLPAPCHSYFRPQHRPGSEFFVRVSEGGVK